uniref:Uncharacterized protein n=1 Tax=viral metagenome TaxID=1070528 RepID=A0A6C0BN59_9ZZZZ
MSFWAQGHQDVKGTHIILVDASGSVRWGRIWDRMLEVCKQEVKTPRMHVLFWNSDNKRQNSNFVNGVWLIPHFVDQKGLAAVFALAKSKIDNSCLTYPHLAFQGIPSQWLNGQIYIDYVTDGQIGYDGMSLHARLGLETRLAAEVKQLCTRNPLATLNIFTVERTDLDFKGQEQINRAAGTDVYKLIQNQGLSKYISRFVTYGPQSHHVHINKMRSIPGYYSYGDRRFRKERMYDFMQFIQADITENKENLDPLLHIAQSLSVTLQQHLVDKPMSLKDQVVAEVAEYFRGSSVDPTLVRFILSEAIDKEGFGSADIFAAYRQKLKQLYKAANELLQKDTKMAINLSRGFFTCPLGDVILTGLSPHMVQHAYRTQRSNHPNAAIEVDGRLVPAFPWERKGDLYSDQCLRQWCRAALSTEYPVQVFSDAVMYLVLAFVCRARYTPDMPPHILAGLCQLAHVMFDKKRRNSDQTEMEFLKAGNQPMGNNGHSDSFPSFMRLVCTALKVNYPPAEMWYYLCGALQDADLLESQRPFFPEELPATPITITPYTVYTLGGDYQCVVTLEDTSSTGGFTINPHGECAPPYVLAAAAMEQYRKQPEFCMCPICYKRLQPDTDFTQVAALTELKLPPLPPRSSQEAKKETKKTQKKTYLEACIFLQGTVGCGKSTFAAGLAEALGPGTFVASVDRHCVDSGLSMPNAIEAVKQELLQMDAKILIVDTCGERTSTKNVFGLNISAGSVIRHRVNYLDRKQTRGYICWTLRNVLKRGNSTPGCGYFLNPVSASLATCLRVHKKKMVGVFGKKVVRQYYPELDSFMSKERVLSSIEDSANEYAGNIGSVADNVQSFLSAHSDLQSS